MTIGTHVEKRPHTNWKGTPLRQLWLTDPDGTLIKGYARLTASELWAMPEGQAPESLVPGTEPAL